MKNSVTTTRSGLQYETLVEVDSDQHPRGNDTLEIHYHGTFIDGTVFDSSIERGQPIDIKLWDAIPGWTEGLKLMSPGDKYRFYIPSRLGYGRTRKDNIPPHSVLIFEIEFLANKAKRNSKRKKK